MFGSDMETNRLVQFKTIVESGGLRSAAALLGISSGGLSKSIQALESELGAKLIRAHGRGIEITRDGMRVYRSIPRLLEALDELRLKTARNEDGRGQPLVRLASFEVFTTYLLAPLLEILGASTRLELREAVPGAIEELVRNESADLGITYLPAPKDGIEFLKVARSEMGIFVRNQAFAKIPAKELPFVIPIVPITGSPTGARGLDGWPEHLFSRKVAHRVDLMESALEICRSGAAAAFLPDFVAELHNREVRPEYSLRRVPLPPEIPRVYRDIFLVKRLSDEEGRLAKQVAKVIRMTCR